MKKSAPQSGQTLLIILLVMAVGLTIALSVVSRSVTDIRISREQEESARAFSAAEAGIEEALRVDLGIDETIPPTAIGGAEYTVSTIGQGGEAEFVFEEAIDEGDTQTVWLVGHDVDGNFDPDPGPSYTGTQIELYWGNDGTGTGDGSCSGNPVPALEATIIYDDDGFKVAKHPLDPDAGRRTACNNFEEVTDIGGGYTLRGKTFNYKKTIGLPSGTNYALRLRLLYNEDTSHLLGVGGIGDDIPGQGKCYESTATVLESGITRKVRQCRSYPAPPAIFDYVLFSGSGLTK